MRGEPYVTAPRRACAYTRAAAAGLDRLIDLFTATDRPEEKKWRAERAKYPNLAAPPGEKK